METENIASPMQNKATSVANILTSRNLRNKKRSSISPITEKAAPLTIEDLEEQVRKPPIAYNPRKRQSQKIEEPESLHMTSRVPIYERLYEQAKLKDAKMAEYEAIKNTNDLSHCTFTPKVHRKQSRSRSDQRIFENLSKSNKNAKEQIYKMRRDAKEMEGCTFQPNVINRSSSRQDGHANIFDRLYNDNQARKKYKRNLEVDKQSFSATQSLADTSFNSAIPRKPNPEVFDKLYSDHDKIKRKKVKQEYDMRQVETEQHPFKPNRITKDKDSEFGLDTSEYSPHAKDVYEKLYRDAEIISSRRDSRQRALQRELQDMSRFSSLSFKQSGKKHISLKHFRKLRP